MKFHYRVTLEYGEQPKPQFTPDATDLRRWLLDAAAVARGIERPDRIEVEDYGHGAEPQELPS